MHEKNRVALMSWFTYQNYGSALQASALYHVINKMGYEPEFINYLPQGKIVEIGRGTLVRKILNKIKRTLSPEYESNERGLLFEEYLETHISRTEPCRSYPELYDLNNKYDAFVCGSDQIWSPICFDSKYFLDFVENTNKMVAYAPSIGLSEIANPIVKDRMKHYISRFKYLSVREQQGADLIAELTGQAAKVVLDPTLLMDASAWNAYVSAKCDQRIENQKYILCYFLGDSDKYLGDVRKISERMKIPFYIIPKTMKEKNGKNAVPFEVGPNEFVSLIKNATYVCTDSFHGLAFSINYNIPFSVFKRFKDSDKENQNSRIFSLLNGLGLEERLVNEHNKNMNNIALSLNFSDANKRLQEMRVRSMQYLQESLKEACNSTGMEMDPFRITDLCCGCGACAVVCPKKAITIKKDAEGFEQSFIDEEKCVRCGQCKKVCPMAHVTAKNLQDAEMLYSVKSCSKEILKSSSSGGIGYELALYLSEKKYAVCGCMYNQDHNSAEHIWVLPEEKEKLSVLQGSKYIQSRLADAINFVRTENSTKQVFFGTPCQAAAVDKLYRKYNLRDKTVIVDLICHGVPSSYLWSKYINYINEEYATGEHPRVEFRSKKMEWRLRLLLLSGNGNTYAKEESKDDFYAFFRRGLCYMKSCSDCPYRERSAADVRIGDYWGERFVNDKEGVSMVIANTLRGKSLIEDLYNEGRCTIQEQKLEEYWIVQYPYNLLRPLIREKLINELKDEKTNIHALRKKYCSYYDKVEAITKMLYSIKRHVKENKE